MRKICFSVLWILVLNCFAQEQSKSKWYEDELKLALSGEPQHNVINKNEIIIKDSSSAVSVAEPILFGIYGKEHIVRERPYEIHFVDDYWIISGTLHNDLPKGTIALTVGGTFLIIINARKGTVIKITHGK